MSLVGPPPTWVLSGNFIRIVRLFAEILVLPLVEAEGYERELFQLGERYFGYKRNRASTALPERVRFDAMIDGQAWCLTLAGNDSFIRVRTP